MQAKPWRAESPKHNDPLVPNKPLIERNMILLEKRAHLVLETTLGVVRLLSVDVTQKHANIRRADGEQSVSALPREIANPLLFHPNGRPGLDLRHDLRRRSRRRQSYRKMNMVGNAAHPKTLAIQFARDAREICMKVGTDIIVDQRKPVLRAEDKMHQVEAQRLRHGTNYMPGLQPSPVLADTYLGLRPRLVCRQAFGLHPMPFQPIPSQPWAQQPTNMSAEGATTYQPGPQAQVRNRQPPRGLKARHIVSAKGTKHTNLGRRPR